MSKPEKRPRIFVTQPIAKTAVDRLRALGAEKLVPTLMFAT